MEISQALFNELLGCLACVAINAQGGYQVDENGKPVIPDEITNYARSTGESLLGMWESITGKKWIVTQEE